MQIPEEKHEQIKFVNWLRTNKILFYAVTNENQHSELDRMAAVMIEKKAKAMGKLKGVSDIVVLLPKRCLYIELKRVKKSLSKVSKEQKAFLDKVNDLDYAKGYVAYGAEEAKNIVLSNL